MHLEGVMQIICHLNYLLPCVAEAFKRAKIATVKGDAVRGNMCLSL